MSPVGKQRRTQSRVLRRERLLRLLALWLGSIGFGALVPFGFAIAFTVYAGFELILGLLALPLFRSEQPARRSP